MERVQRLTVLAAEVVDDGRPSSVVEVPALDDLLDLVGLADRIIAIVVERLIDLQASDEVESATGVPVSLWLAQVARRTRADVRMLQTAADVLPLLPGVRAAFASGRISWSQVRAVVLAVRQFRRSALEAADAHVCGLLSQAPHADPDQISVGLARLAWDIDPAREAQRADRDERQAETGQFFAMQQRLDGTGGRVWGEFAADGFAALDAALNADLIVPSAGDDAGFVGHRDGHRVARRLGAQRADRLVDWAHRAIDDGAAGGTSRRSRAKVIVRTSLDTLLGGRLPADLLTTLTGGKLRVTSQTARRIIDEGGADLRMVVLDDTGNALGVGTRTRVPPGWLRDAALALSATCVGPACETAARVCALDHAVPWHPRGDEPRGPTSVANVGPLCGTQNHRKERAGWTADGTADGQRRWEHARTGLRVHHLPDHWQPAPPRSPPSKDADGHDPDPGDHLPEGEPPDGEPAASSDTSPDDPTVAELLDPPDPDIPF